MNALLTHPCRGADEGSTTNTPESATHVRSSSTSGYPNLNAEEEADTSPQQAEMVSAREDAEAKAAVAKAEAARAKAEADARSVTAGARAAITWSHQPGNGFVMKWVVRLLTKSHRNKLKVKPAAIAAETAPAPVASESSRPESSASKYAVAPGKEEGEISVKDL